MSKILVVEDDDSLRESMAMFLKEFDYNVIVVPNGKVAQDICDIENFDLIISDIRLPDIDGIELLHWVKANHPTPVILMTGFKSIFGNSSAAELGVDAVLSKPFQPQSLMTTIENILKAK